MKTPIFILALCALSVFGNAQTLYVDSSAALGGNGGTWATAFTQLSDALDSAWHNPLIEEVRVAKGTYHPTRNPYEMDINGVGVEKFGPQITNRFKTFHVRTGLKVKGSYPSGGGVQNYALNNTLLSGILANSDSAYHVVYMDSSDNWGQANDTTVLDGFYVENGSASNKVSFIKNSYGGGILLLAGHISLSNCVIRNNFSIEEGGGIYSFTNSNWNVISNRVHFVELLNCTISSNIGLNHAGALLMADEVIVKKCRFVENESTYQGFITVGAGGLQMFCDSGLISDCVFDNNKCTEAAAFVANGKILISGNYVANNTGAYGMSLLGDVTLVNNLIHNNTGRAVHMHSIQGKIINNTIVYNGTGIWMTDGPYVMANNILYGNTLDFIVNVQSPLNVQIDFNSIQADSSNVSVPFNNFPTNATGNIFNQAPLFLDTTSPLGADNIFGTVDDGYQFMSNSPCIDAGNNSLIPTGVSLDITGAPRIDNSIVNMGAYESKAWPTFVKNVELEKLMVYPNPTHQQLYIDLPEQGSLLITDMLGNIIKKHTVKKGSIQLDVSALADGTYFIQLDNQEKSWQTIIIKN